MMVVTVGCGFPRQPYSPWSGPRMTPAADRLAESRYSLTHSLPSPALLRPQSHLQPNGQVSNQRRKDRL